MSAGKKRIIYTACGRCGRIYDRIDHRECPDCHAHRRAAIGGCPATFDLEDMPLRRMPEASH